VNWPESLGPMPEAVRAWEEHRSLAGCETETGLRILIAKADAAIEALKNQLVKSVEWGRIEQKRKQEAEEREHNAIVRAEQAEQLLEDATDQGLAACQLLEEAEAERDELRVRMDDDCTDCAVGVEKHKRQQAEAEVADLNRVLEAGREEYELAVAEMNRRGEEVARLKQFPDEVVKALENARIRPPTLSGSEEYNEGVAHCVEIAADLATRYDPMRGGRHE